MRGGVAQWGYVPNDDSPLVRAAPNVQFIADANNAARFCAVFVNFNLATTDRVRGQGACFEEACCPQPLVEPEGFLTVVAHRSCRLCDQSRPRKFRQGPIL